MAVVNQKKIKDTFKKLLPGIESEEPIKYNASLKDFLKFLAVTEEEVNQIKDVPHQQPFYIFKKLITDMNKCVISGSAVYEHRLVKGMETSDIDFFVELTEENLSIIREFFTYDLYKKVFQKFATEYLPINKFCYRSGYFETTSYEDYGFIKHDNILETYRFGFNPKEQGGFNLNFIFVKKLNNDEMKLFGIRSRESDKLYNNNILYNLGDYYALGSFLCMPITSAEKMAMTTDYLETISYLEYYPKAIPLHHVHTSFDFMELKYVYSFEIQQPISTIIAGKMLLEKFKEKLEKENGEEVQKRLLNNITGEIRKLSEKNEKYMLFENEPGVLTLSKGSLTYNDIQAIKNINDQQNKFNVDLDDIFRGMTKKSINDLYQKTSHFLNNILPRITKYSERGITIRDTQLILSNIFYFHTLYNMYIMQQPLLNKIISKDLLLSGSQYETKKLKVIRSLTKAIEETTSKSNIKIEGKGKDAQTIEF